MRCRVTADKIGQQIGQASCRQGAPDAGEQENSLLILSVQKAGNGCSGKPPALDYPPLILV